MSENSVGRSLKNLVVALINATLLLAALCLWLAWTVLATVRDVSANVTSTAANLQPVGDSINELSEEVRETRAAIDALRQQSSESAVVQATDRLERIETQLSTINERISDVDLERLVEEAVAVAFMEMGRTVGSIIGQPNGDATDD